MAVGEEANFDEAITVEVKAIKNRDIYLKEERKTKKKRTLIFENINTFEKRNKVYTTQWRKIY